MKKERKQIKVASLELNEGQLAWLPKNPRQWTQQDIDLTKQSLEEDPDFLEDRPLLVVKNGKQYIVFAGNLRLTAARSLGWEDVPCVEYYPTNEDEQYVVKRRAMKDNGSFGSWDFDTLGNEWDDMPLADWGVPSWGKATDIDVDGLFQDAGESADKGIKISIEIPKQYEDKLEDIRASVKATLDEWAGCKVS